MPLRSKLIRMAVRNLGCIGSDGIEVALDNIVCIVGRNNVGKSTILRAYELAQSSGKITSDDCCKFQEGEYPEIVLDVHIPEGIGNVADRWKFDDKGIKIVRSRWFWKVVDSNPIRQTWDPNAGDGKGDWDEESKAGGLDTVFNSRLPKPLRIDSLQDANKEHEELLKLITEPVARDLKKVIGDPESVLAKSIGAFVDEALKPVEAYKEQIATTEASIKEKFKGVFPELDLLIKIAIEPPTFDPVRSLLAASSLQVLDSGVETKLKQQGTGARRAMFWSILQVRNAILRSQKAKEQVEKEIADLKNSISKEQKKAKPKQDIIDGFGARIAALTANSDPDDIALPGHILLIDEPENALHPMAIRSAQQHLYELAKDPNWQVMLTTHSPYFINPLEDHTTIVRLERNGKKSSSRTYRASRASFSDEEKENLRALLQIDPSLCEMFFGSYPVIVEGDTEQAAFIAAVLEEKHPLSEQVTLVRARGKALIEPLARLLTHFGVSFGVLHDSDSPFKSDGTKNGMWKENSKIALAVKTAREAGLSVRHRVSIPDFERRLNGEEESKGKPLATYRRVKADGNLRKHVADLIVDLHGGEDHDPFSSKLIDASGGTIMSTLTKLVEEWATKCAVGDVRFFGKEKGTAEPDALPT